MDGGAVIPEESDDDSPSQKVSYTEVFEELFPQYLLYGMTYEQYWKDDPYLARAYAQAYLLKRKVENENMWIQGAYIANAVTISIANTFGKKQHDYLKQPLDIFPKTEREKAEEVRAERQKLIAMLSGFKRAFNKKAKEKTG